MGSGEVLRSIGAGVFRRYNHSGGFDRFSISVPHVVIEKGLVVGKIGPADTNHVRKQEK